MIDLDLTPAERDDFRDMLEAGAHRLTRRRRARTQAIAGAFAVALVAAVSAGVVTGSSFLGNRAPIATTPTDLASPDVTQSAGPVAETPTPTPPAPTPTATHTPPIEQPMTFTYECATQMPDADNPYWTTEEFDTWESVWAIPTISSCTAIPSSGNLVTPEQNHAIDLALDAYGGDREYALIGLHSQCAIPNNGYLTLNTLSGFQDDEVRGMLALCPHRPGADQLNEALAASR